MKDVIGFFYVVIRSEDFFKSVITASKVDLEDFEFNILSLPPENEATLGEKLIYSSLPLEKMEQTENSTGDLRYNLDVNFFSQKFRFLAWEKNSVNLIYEKNLSKAVLIIGLLISSLVTLLFRTFQASALHYEELEKLALEAAEKAQSANYAKSAFLANMSHEIRTPLGAIIGYAEMLASKNMTNEEKKETVSHIKRNGSLLGRLLEDILDSSKIEAGKMVLDPHPIYFPNIINQIESLFRAKCSMKGLTFRVREREPIPKSIVIDEHRLTQVLSNLLNNAIRFTEYGSISVDYGFSEEEGRRYLNFDIMDTGIGIAESHRSNLFQNFGQADASTTRRYGGTGLGLALSKKLAQMMGGDVWLEKSQLSVGSHFKARFALVEADQSQVVQPTKRGGSSVNDDSFDGIFEHKKILLVEDSEDNQDIFSYYLEETKAQLTIVGEVASF